jgi:hypothetical protein
MFTNPIGRAVWDENLWQIACWDYSFESRRGQGCVSFVSLCDGPIPCPEESYRLWCVSLNMIRKTLT